MVHAIRKLAREVHRRSVWQVLGVYLAVSWVGLEGVELATARVGLPAWTPTMALWLLAIGLPVTLATAVVQGGLPGLRMVDAMDPNELEGLTPEQVHVVPTAHPMYGVGILTWRNAVLGGVMAAALLVTSVVAYLTMWALGIGPVGSLLAQGVIVPSDRIVVAELGNATDDMTLGRTLTAALVMDLSESTTVRVLDDRAVAAALVRLGSDAAEPLTSALAQRVAEEEGAAAIVDGEVTRSDGGYRVTVRIVLPPSMTAVSRFRESASDRDGLIRAVDVLAERVRYRFGESLRTIRAEPALVDLYGPLSGLDRW